MLKIGNYYKLKVNLNGRMEEYEGQVLEIINDEFRFETENDNKCRALTLKNSNIIKFYEIKYSKKREKIHKISNKKKFNNLKKSVEPKF